MCLQRLATALLCFISTQLQPAVLRVCLHTLRILSRDRRALGPMVADSALLTMAGLGGISLLQACPQQEEEEAEDQSATAQSSVLLSSSPVEEAGSATTNGSVHHCYNWRDDEGPVVLARGKKDTREENSEEEEKEEDGEVCRKEAIKVLCNVIYNSSMAQERASALR